MEEKDLVINGICFAKYILEGSRLYLKIIPHANQEKTIILPERYGDFEDFITDIIEVVEGVEITQQAFLNI